MSSTGVPRTGAFVQERLRGKSSRERCDAENADLEDEVGLTILADPPSKLSADLARWLRDVGQGAAEPVQEAACHPEAERKIVVPNLRGVIAVGAAFGLLACGEDPYERLARCKALILKANSCTKMETSEQPVSRCEFAVRRLMEPKERGYDTEELERILEEKCPNATPKECLSHARDEWSESERSEVRVCEGIVRDAEMHRAKSE